MKLINSICAAATLAVLASAAPAAAAVKYLNSGDTSAYVEDWAIGSDYVNYAFSSATLDFVGSWQVDSGPNWTVGPVAYSGLGAAAHIFGGSESDYFISTIDNSSANIDHQSWVSTYGGACDGQFPCGTKVAEGFVSGTAGNVPEPASWALLIAGFGLTGAAMRRRRSVAFAA